MEALVIGGLAVLCLAGLAAWGWCIALATKKYNGVLEGENAELRSQLSMRREQDRAFDMARGRDLANDADFVSDTGVQLEGIHAKG